MKKFLIGLMGAALLPASAMAQNADDMTPGQLMITAGITCSKQIQEQQYAISAANECKKIGESITVLVKDSSGQISASDRNMGVLGGMITYQTIGTAETAAGMSSTACTSYKQSLDLGPFYTKGLTPDFDKTFDDMVTNTRKFSVDNGCS